MTAKNSHRSVLLPLPALLLWTACTAGATPQPAALDSTPSASATSNLPGAEAGPALVFKIEAARTARGVRELLEHLSADDSRYTTEEREQAMLARFAVLGALVLLLRVEHADEPGWEDRFDAAVIHIVRVVVGVDESELPSPTTEPEEDESESETPPANERGLRLLPGQRGA